MQDRKIDNGKIYVLKDPTDGSVRYVGKFEGKYLNKRLNTHIYEAFEGKSDNHRLNWIRFLVGKQRTPPIIELVQDGFKTRKELCEAEIFLIQFCKDIGLKLLNSTIGGDSGNGLSGENHYCFGEPKSEEFKQKLSMKLSGSGNPMFGKTHTEESKLKISQNHADVSGEKNPMYGKPGKGSKKGRKFSEEAKKNISASRSGKKRGSYKKKEKIDGLKVL
jgi:hypothetical protein